MLKRSSGPKTDPARNILNKIYFFYRQHAALDFKDNWKTAAKGGPFVSNKKFHK